MQHVDLYHIDSQTIRLLDYDAYRVNPNGKFPWLQHALFWLIEKLGGRGVSFKSDFLITTRLNLDDVAEMIWKNEEAVWNITHREGKYVIIGRKQMRELSVHPEFHAFGMSHPTFGPLQIIMAPWLDGVFVLPEIK